MDLGQSQSRTPIGEHELGHKRKAGFLNAMPVVDQNHQEAEAIKFQDCPLKEWEGRECWDLRMWKCCGGGELKSFETYIIISSINTPSSQPNIHISVAWESKMSLKSSCPKSAF